MITTNSTGSKASRQLTVASPFGAEPDRLTECHAGGEAVANAPR